MEKYKVGGYVKLAKLWKRDASSAYQYHRSYYEDKFSGVEGFSLYDVYTDITGFKEITRRPEMLRLLRDCKMNYVNCIASQTKAYLASSTEDFFFLIHYLFSLPHRIDILTEDQDYNINTVVNPDNQREALERAASKYVSVEPQRYTDWLSGITLKMNEL